jgi:hypothetical protein
MDPMDNPEVSSLDLFGLDFDELAKQKRLAEAWKENGKEGLRQELADMYPEKVNPKPADFPKSRS